MTTLEAPVTSTETDDLLSTLATHRGFFRQTVQGLTDEQARTRTTVSELTLAGLVKHVAGIESMWAEFCLRGTESFQTAEWAAGDGAPADPDAPRPDFVATGAETVESLLARYAEVAARTEEVVRSVPDLGTTHELPVTPWWPEGGAWSVRRAVLHVLAETAQHAGHADILREALDGQKTMG